MTNSTRPPAGLEIKGAATILAPRPTAPTPGHRHGGVGWIVALIAAQ